MTAWVQLGLLAAVLGVAPAGARAQLLGQYEPSGIPGYQNWFSDAVLDRSRTEYDALGVRAGSFLIRPSLSESLGYDSNIFGAAHPVGSPVAETAGKILLNSGWSRHEIDADISFDDQRYLRHADASHTDWAASLGGAVDLGRDRATLAYTHVGTTILADEIGTLNGGQPVALAIDTAHAGYEASLGNFTLVPAVTAATYRFANALVAGPSPVANNHDSLTGSLSAGYALAPGSSLLAIASFDRTAYTTRVSGVPTADYDDASLVGGFDFRTGTLFRYRALAGFEQRSYDSAQLPDTTAPLAEFDVIWAPTLLTTVTGEVSRSLESAITGGVAASYTYTKLRLVLDHELRRNVLLQAFGEFQNAEYRTHGQTQHEATAGASVTWLLNRQISMVGSYAYLETTNNFDATLNETRHLVTLALSFHP